MWMARSQTQLGWLKTMHVGPAHPSPPIATTLPGPFRVSMSASLSWGSRLCLNSLMPTRRRDRAGGLCVISCEQHDPLDTDPAEVRYRFPCPFKELVGDKNRIDSPAQWK